MLIYQIELWMDTLYIRWFGLLKRFLRNKFRSSPELSCSSCSQVVLTHLCEVYFVLPFVGAVSHVALRRFFVRVFQILRSYWGLGEMEIALNINILTIIVIMFIFLNTTIHDTGNVLVHNSLIYCVRQNDYTEGKSYDCIPLYIGQN